MNGIGTLYNLSLPLRELGRIDEATALGREALRIAEASIGADHPTTAIYLHGLADTLRRTDPRAALDLLERGVESARNAFGERHPVYAAFAASLGACHRALGDPARARILLDQSVAILEAPSVPVEPTELATALHERGLVLAALADPAAALADQERALAMMRQVRGDEHSSLAPMLRAIGDAQEAVPRP